MEGGNSTVVRPHYLIVTFNFMQALKIPTPLQEIIDTGTLTIRSKPFQDKEVGGGCGVSVHCVGLFVRHGRLLVPWVVFVGAPAAVLSLLHHQPSLQPHRKLLHPLQATVCLLVCVIWYCPSTCSEWMSDWVPISCVCMLLFKQKFCHWWSLCWRMVSGQ